MNGFAAFQAPPPPCPPRPLGGGVCEGYLYRLPPPADVDVLWLVLYETDRTDRPFYLAACDRLTVFQAAGAHDTLIPSGDPASPLVVRPMIGAWASRQVLERAGPVSEVTPATLTLAQLACAEAVQEPRDTPLGVVTPGLESYREYVVWLVIHQRRCATHAG